MADVTLSNAVAHALKLAAAPGAAPAAPAPAASYSPQADAAAFEPARDRYLYAKYGIGDKQYDALLIAQRYVCAICQAPHNAQRPLVVDHNHQTGKVRGLLCAECNSGIGLLQDSIAILGSAVHYLAVEGSYAPTPAPALSPVAQDGPDATAPDAPHTPDAPQPAPQGQEVGQEVGQEPTTP
jgi:Recombination endonuclease VII